MNAIQEDKKDNFRKIGSGFDFCKTPYDLNSIMHYNSFAFTRFANLPTILTKNGSIIEFRRELSDLDVACLREYYGCSGIFR